MNGKKLPMTMVLIHSPLVGPFTWALVAQRLQKRGIPGVVPSLTSSPASPSPHWRQHATAVARALRLIPIDWPVLLVGHSGAGPLLPSIRQSLAHPVAGYLFVDAGWPEDNKSRLDMFENPEGAEQFRRSAQDGLLPMWSEEDLMPVIPDDAIRRQFVGDLRPLPLSVYEEKLPVFSGWPDAPCGYLRFGGNPAYDRSFSQAQRLGFPVLQLEGEHFHMLVDPEAVTEAVLALVSRMGISIY